jgi:hypothetical protein
MFVVQTIEPLSIWARVRSTSLNIASLLRASLYSVFRSKPVSRIRCSMAYRGRLAGSTSAMHAVSNSDSEGSRDDQGKPSGERCNGQPCAEETESSSKSSKSSPWLSSISSPGNGGGLSTKQRSERKVVSSGSSSANLVTSEAEGSGEAHL